MKTYEQYQQEALGKMNDKQREAAKRGAEVVDYIMGHDDGSMARNYTHGADDDRLQAVVDHVRAKLAPLFVLINGGDQ